MTLALVLRNGKGCRALSAGDGAALGARGGVWQHGKAGGGRAAIAGQVGAAAGQNDLGRFVRGQRQHAAGTGQQLAIASEWQSRQLRRGHPARRGCRALRVAAERVHSASPRADRCSSLCCAAAQQSGQQLCHRCNRRGCASQQVATAVTSRHAKRRGSGAGVPQVQTDRVGAANHGRSGCAPRPSLHPCDHGGVPVGQQQTAKSRALALACLRWLSLALPPVCRCNPKQGAEASDSATAARPAAAARADSGTALTLARCLPAPPSHHRR